MHVKTPDRVSAEATESFPEYPELVVQLLQNRGLTTLKEIERFFDPQYDDLHDPFAFKDMNAACSRIYDAIKKNETIAVYGDYDADGVSAAVVLTSTLNSLGAKTEIYIPHRDKEGYGLNAQAVDYLHEKQVNVIITCDCGISNVDPIAHANSLNIDTIITDHHDIPKTLPEAHAIIHPKIENESYPEKNLAGGGVAFKLAQGLYRSEQCSLTDHEREAAEKWLLDLAAISTVADMVLLRGENRVIATYGLLILRKNKRLGMQKLLEVGRIDPDAITSETISFQIAPRINAAGRMDHASAAYMLLSTDNEKEATQYAQLIEEQNRSRQRETERVFKEAIAESSDDTRCVLVYNPDWPAGLTGLVAGKLSKEFKKPAFVLCDSSGFIVGSGRAPDGVSVIDAVRSTQESFAAFGGHPQACGFRFDPEKLDQVRESLVHYYDSIDGIDELTSAPKSVDAKIKLSDITWDLTKYIERFAPFGQGNPEPSWYTAQARVVSARSVGSKSNHCKLIIEQNGKSIPAIAFNESRSFSQNEEISLSYAIRVNQWNGNREIQLVIDQIWKKDD